MVENPPSGSPRISPYLLYEDATAAVEWLTEAFGFENRERLTDASGAVNHAELGLDGGIVMLGQPGADYQNPSHSGHRHSQVYVYVDDVDAHFERARGGCDHPPAANRPVLRRPALRRSRPRGPRMVLRHPRPGRERGRDAARTDRAGAVADRRATASHWPAMAATRHRTRDRATASAAGPAHRGPSTPWSSRRRHPAGTASHRRG